MYSGWTSKWPINRPLQQVEKDAALPRQQQETTKPDDHATLVSFNSTYAEFVGRRFLLRGGASTVFFSLATLVLICLPFLSFTPSSGKESEIIGFSIFTIFSAAWILLFVIKILSKDFFTHTYYPIRFNRKTRQVYVFRDKRDGGILTVPWDDVFFHIGRGLRDPVYDLRGHLLEGDTVKDTFVTGLYYADSDTVKELWEFVRCYMDEDINDLGKVELWTSPSTSFYNCWLLAGINIGIKRNFQIKLLFPLLVLLTSTRWLVMKTSKPPVWPAEIEAACRIHQDDPLRLPEPKYIGQFGIERERAKHSS
ncbi:MAG: hypothetical protein P8014_19970 [Acidihalobacter sp.]|uniref:DUF6708 domain-containing protein n=1 Tax=Acidihalobacter sp. TaxID=1872108 RepID=UPI00307E20DF